MHPDQIQTRSFSNKKERFQFFLNQFPVDRQRALLLQLCQQHFEHYEKTPEEIALIKREVQRIEAMLGGSAVDVSAAEVLVGMSSAAVGDAWQKALKRRTDDPDGAITMARTLLESVCKTILDDREIEYASDADLPKVCSLALKQLNLSPSQHSDELFKKILGSCQQVIEGVGALRNHLGDAHGNGRGHMKPAPRHAELTVNLAGAMAMFLSRTWEERIAPK
jgi:hypothetical protein